MKLVGRARTNKRVVNRITDICVFGNVIHSQINRGFSWIRMYSIDFSQYIYICRHFKSSSNDYKQMVFDSHKKQKDSLTKQVFYVDFDPQIINRDL